MVSVETATVFFGASLLLALSPGPDNLFVLSQSALYGRASGLIIVLGLCTGLVVQTVAVALGVAAIVQTSPLAFTLLKVLGAGYLLYLAWKAFRAPAAEAGAGAGGTPWTMYGRGIIMNITNPKVSIFFLAFLPQFAEPARGPVFFQLLLLGGVFMLATLLVFGSIAFLAGYLGAVLSRSARIQKTVNRFAGAIFLGLALRLATMGRS